MLNPSLTLAEIERGLRQVFARDPVRAERAVGNLYGQVFKNKELRYDAAGGRWLGVPEWS